MAADEAIVLVGGLGTRLRPVLTEVPKPLAPVAGRPFLAWVLDRLADQRINHVVLATGHLAAQVEAAIGHAWKHMRVSYSVETQPLGTGGAIRLARPLLAGGGVHVLNGDTYLRYDLDRLSGLIDSGAADLAMALAQVPDAARYGAVQCTGDSVSAFLEKGTIGPGMINAGCYFIGPVALSALPAKEVFSFETDVLAPMVAAGRVRAETRTDGFIDIGIPEDYRRAQAMFGQAQ